MLGILNLWVMCCVAVFFAFTTKTYLVEIELMVYVITNIPTLYTYWRSAFNGRLFFVFSSKDEKHKKLLYLIPSNKRRLICLIFLFWNIITGVSYRGVPRYSESSAVARRGQWNPTLCSQLLFSLKELYL